MELAAVPAKYEQPVETVSIATLEVDEPPQDASIGAEYHNASYDAEVLARCVHAALARGMSV